MRIILLLAMAVGASFVGSNCGGSGVGDPCVPEDEYLTTFSGFAVSEVNVESRSFQCLTRVCLVNHFQGRVSCPYGQVEDPSLPKDSGRAACAPNVVADDSVPGDRYYTCNGADGIAGTSDDGGSKCNDTTCAPGGLDHDLSCRIPFGDGGKLEDRIQVPVDPQLFDRQAHDAVYCSCRCDGPDPNARYCECPSGFACEELVDELNLGKGQLAGSYCVKEGTSYEDGKASGGDCSPKSGKLCGPDCEGCAERDESGTCIKAGERDCYEVERATDGNAVRSPRNWGSECEGSGVICKDDTRCCAPGEPDANGNRDTVRTPCSEVGVDVAITTGELAGTTVKACP